MTNEKDLSQTATNVPTVAVTAKYLDALRKAVGLRIESKVPVFITRREYVAINREHLRGRH
jgi:hypothetical protein